ncbi:MAG: DUF1549 and DUF1553 domain-containing protein, partial [Verrucomicrobiota bacterium]|nr:DUF1549 and DUF1553 domain-containing protein [Verrucomicrobiota bacterium]
MVATLCVCAIAFPLHAADPIQILPQKIKLTGPAARQQLVVEKIRDKQFVEQVTNKIIFSSSDPKILTIKNGVALPTGNGTATLSAKVGNKTAKTEVIVEGMEKPFEWSFRNHVQPVLTKAGCNAGACHGAAAGQNGLKLSLRGYDDESDFLALTRQSLGRRVNENDPGRSMILIKPTTAVPHKGGKRFEINSIDYRVLADWIAAATPGPKKEDPRIQKIEILPENVVLKSGMNQQLIVRAHFDDGHVEDVSHWAKYNAANAAVTQVDDEGNVKVIGNGEGAITAWYLSRIAIATVTSPFTNKIPEQIFAKAKKRNFIDEMVLEKLQSLRLPPSPKSDDAEFIRRVYLDTIGVLPTMRETKEFLADKSSKKRDALIEKLLQRPEFVDYWTYKWSDLLLVNSRKLKPGAMWSYYNWIRGNVAANTPWDKFVRQIMTAEGSTLENGAGNFYVLHEDPKALIENTSLAFLGMSVACAKCHNHPMEKWTNDEYFGFANLFARVRAKNGSGGDGDNIIFVASEGDLVQPRTGKPQPPRPLEGKTLPMESPTDRRAALADWLVSRDNPYFSRAIVNRVWANYFGVGLVENVDDLRVTNPASNEKLLSAAAHYLADQKFDLKALMRAILQSETYQRTSRPLPENVADTRFYSRYYPRRLMAEVMLDAISQATEKPSDFKAGAIVDKGPSAATYPNNLRALQLPDSNVDSYFLKSFGRPEREKTCECERTAEPSISQVLHLANGDTINKKLEAKDNRIAKWLAQKTPDEKILDEIYLSALARPPSES